MLPIDRPGKIVCVGLNYSDHAEEQGVDLPKEPLLFAKWTTALIGPGDPIVIPPIVTTADYEAELGVVIGERVSRVSKENAFEAVRGYLCANDVSARDLQFGDGQWTRGKSPDTFCPVGPLTPRDEISNPHALGIRAIVSGETLQDSTTANLIFGIDDVIAYASQTTTSLPAGHAEGFADTFKELYRAVYRAAAEGGPPDEPDYPTFRAGHVENAIAEAVARSDREERWVEVET